MIPSRSRRKMQKWILHKNKIINLPSTQCGKSYFTPPRLKRCSKRKMKAEIAFDADCCSFCKYLHPEIIIISHKSFSYSNLRVFASKEIAFTQRISILMNFKCFVSFMFFFTWLRDAKLFQHFWNILVFLRCLKFCQLIK